MPAQVNISVVMPLYNKRREARRSIQSVLDQSYPHFELIVVDDGSTDGSATVPEEIEDERLRLVRQTNAGVSAARNRGIQEANGRLIAFLDADDEWSPDFLLTVWNLYQQYPQAGIFGTAYKWCLPGGQFEKLELPQLPKPPWCGIVPNYFRAALDSPLLWSSAVAVPKNVFDTVGNFQVGISLGEDIDMWLRIALQYPVAYSYTFQAIYHQDASNRAMLKSRCNENLVLATSASDAIKNGTVPAEFEDDLCEYVYMYRLITAAECAKAGNLKCARHHLSASKATSRFRKQWLWWRLWTAMPKPLFNLAWKTKRIVKP